MKIGITVPNNWGVEDVHDVVALGEQAEQLGFDSVWTMDHLFNIGFVRDRLDNKPYFHPLGILSFLAARTTTMIPDRATPRPGPAAACVAGSSSVHGRSASHALPRWRGSAHALVRHD